MRHLRGLPAVVWTHLQCAAYCADIAREAIGDLIHHRTRLWPK